MVVLLSGTPGSTDNRYMWVGIPGKTVCSTNTGNITSIALGMNATDGFDVDMNYCNISGVTYYWFAALRP